MHPPTYTALQLDALGELANIGSGQAATALAAMLGRPVDISIPAVRALALADAVDALGPGEEQVTAVVLPVRGALDAAVLLLFGPADADRIVGLLGVPADDRALADSAIGEVGNVLGSTYLRAIAALAGGDVEPAPPTTLVDMRAALVASALATGPADYDAAILLDSQLTVAGEQCELAFVLLCGSADVARLLARIGLGA